MANIELVPPRDRNLATPLWPADLSFAALLVIAFVYLIHEGHGLKFFFDEWTWIELRHSGAASILDAYNQHEEIIPLAVYQLLFHTVGLGTYHWYRLLATLGHLAVLTAIYTFARSRIGPLALLVAVPVAFLGAGWEFILWGINFGFTTSIALSIAALIWLDSERRSSWVGCALLVLGVLVTETAVLFAIGLAAELTWRDLSLRRAWVWVVPILIYVAWYVGYFPPAGHHNVAAVPGFGAQLAAAAAGGWFGQGESVGWFALGLLAACLIFRVVFRGAFTPRLLGVLLTVLGYWALVAVGRSSLGDPTASRYVYSGGVILVLVLIEGLRGIRVSWLTLLVGAPLCVLATLGGLHAFAPGANELREGSTDTAAELTALNLVKGKVAADFVLDPHWAPQITPALYFPAVADLGSTGADTPAELTIAGEEANAAADAVLLRASELTVTRLARVPARGRSVPHVELRFRGSLSSTGSCLRYVPAGSGSTLDLTLPGGGLSVQVQRAGLNHPPTQILARRFADGYENAPVAVFRSARTLLIRARPDAAHQAWHVRISPWATVTACSVRG